ncbi:MAG: TIGR03960 family B12-binding radical SAM protein [Planctomycetia bacterium]|nr:TIGR03960 family B12-binding radical SAM protein [Planctomycetia bacterium]
MFNHALKELVDRRVLTRVQNPIAYAGGELNSVAKDHRTVRGKLCLAFPDLYTIGMSNQGMQVLYTLMNQRDDWACERSYAPMLDMEERLRAEGLPLYSLETFTPLAEFDVVGFSLQYEISYAGILTMLDLGGIPLRGESRTLAHPLVIAGGPCTQNPEPLAPFIDLFITGDGEPSLPMACDAWLDACDEVLGGAPPASGSLGQLQREEALALVAARLPFAYVPRFYEARYADDGTFQSLRPTRGEARATIEPSVIGDLENAVLPLAPIVPYAECVHDRIAVEIMRGCPWQCRFCQSTVIKRPLRIRSVENIVESALTMYRNTGIDQVSLLSLSSSDYPYFEQLVRRMHETFVPLGVRIALPSLRVNEQLKALTTLIEGDNRGLTLAPEVARDDMREQIRKKIKNEDLFEGCRSAFANGYTHVKLYFLIGLPGERQIDLDGIIDMGETISRIGREVNGRNAPVTVSVSNFVPKAHTPYQWNGMQTREYFAWAHKYLRQRQNVKAVKLKCTDVEVSMLEGVLSRGDRRIGDVIERAWRSGARLESWYEHFDAERWWTAMRELGLDPNVTLHRPYPLMDRLPWDHINVKKGRTFLEKEQQRATLQLKEMATAV